MEGFWLYIHLGFLALAIVGILLADRLAFSWMQGRRELLEEHELVVPHWIVTIALSGLVYTGLYLFWPLRDYLLDQSAFWLKMAFVFALLINSFFIEALMPHTTQSSHAELEPAKRRRLMLSGGVSFISWVGAVVMAFYIFGWLF